MTVATTNKKSRLLLPLYVILTPRQYLYTSNHQQTAPLHLHTRCSLSSLMLRRNSLMNMLAATNVANYFLTTVQISALIATLMQLPMFHLLSSSNLARTTPLLLQLLQSHVLLYLVWHILLQQMKTTPWNHSVSLQSLRLLLHASCLCQTSRNC
jgi:hypothetical protein